MIRSYKKYKNIHEAEYSYIFHDIEGYVQEKGLEVLKREDNSIWLKSKHGKIFSIFVKHGEVLHIDSIITLNDWTWMANESGFDPIENDDVFEVFHQTVPTFKSIDFKQAIKKILEHDKDNVFYIEYYKYDSGINYPGYEKVKHEFLSDINTFIAEVVKKITPLYRTWFFKDDSTYEILRKDEEHFVTKLDLTFNE